MVNSGLHAILLIFVVLISVLFLPKFGNPDSLLQSRVIGNVVTGEAPPPYLDGTSYDYVEETSPQETDTSTTGEISTPQQTSTTSTTEIQEPATTQPSTTTSQITPPGQTPATQQPTSIKTTSQAGINEAGAVFDYQDLRETRCGNGVIEISEVCDDGNSFEGDGCSSTCAIEQNLGLCEFTTASWKVTNAVEGDRVTLTLGGNSNCNGGGVGFTVFEQDVGGGDYVSLNPQASTFANSIAASTWVAEWQDDCSGLCNPPEYYFEAILGADNSVGISSKKTSDNLLQVNKGANKLCGDSFVEGVEECDEGSKNSDIEGNACRIDNCPNNKQQCCNSWCGDGVKDTGETCDWSYYNGKQCNPVSGEICVWCNSQCGLVVERGVSTFCGDGIVEIWEECDDGPLNSDTLGDACRTTCKLAYCGDSVRDSGEECDDGNSNNLDGCTQCKFDNCGPGHYDCDNNLYNGCETDVNTDERNCGACGNLCGVGQVCVAGTCI